MDFLTASLQINTMSIFEAGMLLCFGISWPFMIRKTLVTKITKGQSKRFLSIILAGYICGIFHKVLYNMDIVFWLYVINFTLVAFELILTFVYGKENNAEI